VLPIPIERGIIGVGHATQERRISERSLFSSSRFCPFVSQGGRLLLTCVPPSDRGRARRAHGAATASDNDPWVSKRWREIRPAGRPRRALKTAHPMKQFTNGGDFADLSPVPKSGVLVCEVTVFFW
jgi:hypothetical protein